MKTEYIHTVNVKDNTAFPYLVMDVTEKSSVPYNPGFQVFHWHEELQFIYVMEGSTEVCTLNDYVILHEGEALFINKEAVHIVKPAGSCHYKSFMVPEYFLKFYFGSPAGILVDEVVERKDFEFFRFSEKEEWGKQVLLNLDRLVKLDNRKDEFYCYEVLTLLTQIFLVMRKNINLSVKINYSTVNIRMQKFLHTIEQRYAEDLSLEKIAESAGVGKTECLRCFRESLHTTPYKYLVEYRLFRASLLLETTDLSIGEISEKTGFNQMSHFGKSFRKKTGMTPAEYRKSRSQLN